MGKVKLLGGSQENLNEVLTEQEDIITQIKAILPFKGAGMSEGQYVWKKLTAEGGEFIDFVVSSDTEAYPNGGELDGYWYELVEEGTNLPKLFGCTKIAMDTFTLSTRTRCWNDAVRINHSLAERPIVMLLITDVSITTFAEDDIIASFYVLNNPRSMSEYYLSGVAFTKDKDVSGGVATQAHGNNYNYITEQFITFNIGLAAYIKAGVEYTLITMA